MGAMTIRLNPYISFNNNAREAIEFYHSVFGGELTINTFAELHASQDHSEDDLVMHSMLVTPNGLTLMASDTTQRMAYTPGDNMTVSLSGEAQDEETLKGYWRDLMVGGTESMPLSKAVWATRSAWEPTNSASAGW
jgi:PhnB protein